MNDSPSRSRQTATDTRARAQQRRRHPTRRQAELREAAFYLHVDGYSCRQIAAKLEITKDTAAAYVRYESEKRAPEFEKQREAAAFQSVSFYQGIKRRALEMHAAIQETLDNIAENANFEGQVRITEHYLADATKAQERIDKILGTDAAVKLDAGLQQLAEALREADDPNRKLAGQE